MKKKWDNWGNDSRLPLAKYEDMSRNAKYQLFVDPTLFSKFTQGIFTQKEARNFLNPTVIMIHAQAFSKDRQHNGQKKKDK